MPTSFDTEFLAAALAGYQWKRAEIDARMARSRKDRRPSPGSAVKPVAAPAKKKRRLSPEGRARIIARHQEALGRRPEGQSRGREIGAGYNPADSRNGGEISKTLALSALLIFAATYLVLAIGRLPGFRVDRTGAAIIGASLMVAANVLTVERGLCTPSITTPSSSCSA